jgi:hypothetical protein
MILARFKASSCFSFSSRSLEEFNFSWPAEKKRKNVELQSELAVYLAPSKEEWSCWIGDGKVQKGDE